MLTLVSTPSVLFQDLNDCLISTLYLCISTPAERTSLVLPPELCHTARWPVDLWSLNSTIYEKSPNYVDSWETCLERKTQSSFEICHFNLIWQVFCVHYIAKSIGPTAFYSLSILCSYILTLLSRSVRRFRSGFLKEYYHVSNHPPPSSLYTVILCPPPLKSSLYSVLNTDELGLPITKSEGTLLMGTDIWLNIVISMLEDATFSLWNC